LGEAELSKGTGTQIGTTKQGIGPCYSDKALRTNLRVGDLRFFDKVQDALTRLVEQKKKRFGDFEYDLEGEIKEYREYAKRLEPYIGSSFFTLVEVVHPVMVVCKV